MTKTPNPTHGLSIMVIDTDPDTNMLLALSNMSQPGSPLEFVTCVPRTFSTGRKGWVIVTYERAKDAHAHDASQRLSDQLPAGTDG